MKNIRFTQSINLSVTVEVSVPDDMSDEDIHELARNCPLEVMVDYPTSDELPDDVVYISQKIDGAEITDGQVW